MRKIGAGRGSRARPEPALRQLPQSRTYRICDLRRGDRSGRDVGVSDELLREELEFQHRALRDILRGLIQGEIEIGVIKSFVSTYFVMGAGGFFPMKKTWGKISVG